MRIKICGLFRDEDIDFVNEARPDYAGFVFAQSGRQVSPPLAQYLRFRLASGIIPVGVFVNAPADFIAQLYHSGVISAAQLHGDEDDGYIDRLKKLSETNSGRRKNEPIKVIKSICINKTAKKNEQTAGKIIRNNSRGSLFNSFPVNADFLLLDSGAGSGKTFDWKQLNSIEFPKPWFLAGGINIKNIKQATELNPFAIDVSSGAETDGFKDREKILQLVSMCRQ